MAHKDIFVTRRLPQHRRLEDAGGLPLALRRHRGAQLAEAGMVTLGKLNCDEFAMGSSNENSAFGPVQQPLGHQRAFPAARPAAARWRWRRGWCRRPPAPTPAARSASRPRSAASPASSRPTARASRYGMIAFASSLDQAGPMARSAEDCALLLSAMCGAATPTAIRTSLDAPARGLHAGAGRARSKGLRIGVPREFFGEGLAADVRAAIEPRCSSTRSWAPRWWRSRCRAPSCRFPVYYIIAPAEASLQPVALRRREVRPPRQAVHRPARHVQEDPRRRLRRRRSSAAS